MSKFICASVLLLFLHSGFAQESKRISLSFEDELLTNVLKQIEENSNKKIFFAENWIPSKRVSGNYRDEELEVVLNDLFDGTLLNYYKLDSNRIVLTQNSIIYDELPEGFFPEPGTDITQPENGPEQITTEGPVFFNNSNLNSEIETVRIGKESAQNKQRSYNLSGRVLDKKTGEPISNLAIVVEGLGTGTSTDIDGYYSITLRPGINMIRTKSLTNENIQKRVIIYNSGILNLNLSENLEQLGEVQISSNADKNIDNANAGQEQIDVENIKNIPLVLGERDIMKVAVTLPGISTTGEGSSGFNVRGGKSDQNLILLDDAVIYNPAHFFGIFSAINPFTSGEVNIYKGNIPAKFGGRLSSVFDIKTKDASTTDFQGEASIGPVTSNLALQIPIVQEKSGLMIGGRSTYSDWILRNIDEESLNNSTAFFYDAIAKYNHEIGESGNLEATGYISRDRFSITSDSIYSYENRLLNLHYNHRFNDKNRGELILTNSDYRFNIDYENNLANNFTSGYRINETELKLDMTYILNSNHRFNYGLSNKLYNIEPGEIQPVGENSDILPISLQRERGLESAVYVADEYEVNDRLLVSAGFRYSFFSAFGEKDINIYEDGVPENENVILDTVSYGNLESIKTYGGPEVRISGRYYLLDDLSLKASYNNTIQYIHTLSNNTTVSPTDTYRLSGFHLEPQRAQQFSLGLFKNFDSNTIETSIEGYYKTSRNTLDFKVGADLFLNENIETETIQGDGKSYGVELLLRKNSGDFNGWIGYTYSRSFLKLDSEFREERVNDGEFFPSNFDKPHDFSFVGNYKLTQRFSFSANFVYQTGRPITYPVGQYIYNNAEYVLYSDRNQFRIPDYYRLDLSFNLEGNHKLVKLGHTFWNFSVYNVLGRNNPYSVFFVTEDGEVEGKQSSIFSVPVPTISFNFQF